MPELQSGAYAREQECRCCGDPYCRHPPCPLHPVRVTATVERIRRRLRQTPWRDEPTDSGTEAAP